MYQVPQVVEGVYYVGVNDRTKTLFENIWPLPEGVSYNSYLIVDEQVTLIDTVDVCYSDVFFHKLESILGDRPVDLLVVNHMEPDHGGSIGLLRQRYPNMKIVGNKKTFDMLRGYHNITEGLLEVKSGDAIRIGERELSFLLAPMVHWPEVMFTYESKDKILFSADAFGSFGSLNGHIFDYQIDLDSYLPEMRRYYACIVGKYGTFVQRAMDNLTKQSLEINYVCPTHGIIWTEKRFDKAWDLYEKLSKAECEDGVVVLFGSMYGNTEVLADVIATSLAAHGVERIICHNVSKSDPSVILRDIFRYKGLIIGSPTYCGDLFSPISYILSLLKIRDVKGKLYSCFGSSTWAPMSVKKLVPVAEEMDWTLVGAPAELKMADQLPAHDAAWALGKAMAEALEGKLPQEETETKEEK